MNRTLIVLALAASTAIATLASAPHAHAGDPECRYVVPPAPPPPVQSENRLLQIGPIDGRNDGTTRSLTVSQPRWSVIGLRPHGTADYNLRVFRCQDESELGFSAYGAGEVDFVAMDGNREWAAGPVYASYSRYPLSVAGVFDAEYSAGGSPLVAGAAQSLALRGTPAIVRDLSMTAGTRATIRLRVATGNPDLYIIESGVDSPQWSRARGHAVASSTNRGSADEEIMIALPAGVPGKTFGVVVTNNTGHAEFVLTRS